MASQLVCGSYHLSLELPLVMGIVNVTPNSFSDGGRHFDAARAVMHGRQLVEEGADMLDVGGESSRPGAHSVSTEEELRRVLPVIEALADCGVPLSVDTVKPEVMRRAVAAGASVINDISALRAPEALVAAAESGAAVCLMHMQGEPRTMQTAPSYGDVVKEVRAFLAVRVAAVQKAGIPGERIIVDPGFGFGKRLAHNLALLRHLDTFRGLGACVLAGLSRKSMLGEITGRKVSERGTASVAAALLAAQNGARILRVHDVAATKDALAVWAAMEG
ncbi:MAG: dihydropteroate synthase [Rhodocyclaceae bacterium]|nr:dihydropteroate synthase [Rhodocyclaceae bacterium]PKO70890.1 MAG: dihydropteroate synthase [Betaproteobacteria bacterium HGW-Betaproteobacteria-14]PKO94770.1 MAG: dihydropteroate synthase [Betaproteobacteria bacterium HGW-Betaproteobacteria-10]